MLRANIETPYGIVHIIDGLMDRPRLMDACPSLRERLSSTGEGQQVENVVASHSISLRKVSDEDLLVGQNDPSIKNNELELDNRFDAGFVVVPFPDDSTESKYGNKQFSLNIKKK